MSDLSPATRRQGAEGSGEGHNVPFTRRTVLTGAAAATTAATVGGVYTLLPGVASSEPAPSDLGDFIRLSAALTGIDASKLAPGTDPINIKTEYFDWVRAQSPEAFNNLLTFFRSSSNSARFLDSLSEAPQSNTEIGGLARSIVLLWYLGAWYDPKDLRNVDQQLMPEIISAKAYTQAWIWRVAQTHPMGYSEWAFGYWQDEPPLLNKFIKPR
jgi:Membrane bound FAD containing D-sorbitol dehydrogenase